MSASKRSKGKKKTSEICFVIMPFGNPFDMYYEKIYSKAIIQLGLLPKRADSLFRSSPIMDDIWNFVLNSKIIFAELTGRNPNVFYELGLAHAAGKPVILISENVVDIPFDLKSLRVLTYNKEDPHWGDNLLKNIVVAIEETLESPQDSIPTSFLNKTPIKRPEIDNIEFKFLEIERSLKLIIETLPPKILDEDKKGEKFDSEGIYRDHNGFLRCGHKYLE